MDATSDAELARLLQFQFDSETATEIANIQPVLTDERRSSGTKPIGIVDQRWELIDPNPDVRALFLQFNEQFFWGRLAGVEVRWSPRMTLCAGVCCYEGYGGLCSVRLSLPLLKLRPRKDLVETLLHEMIHAYLFVTQNNKDHDGHGPEFCKHMNRINTATGTHISIYHTFHDEVDLYRQHWWRCDGPCRQRKPYFGYVKRSMNRAPSSRDTWWGEHQRSCGGSYTKVKEPEGYGQKKGGGKKKGQEGEEGGSKESINTKDEPGKQDIRNFIPFSGKGQSLGKPATSTSSGSSSKPPSAGLPVSMSAARGTVPGSATSDKHRGQIKERKTSSEGKDISSFFTKKGMDPPTHTATSSAGKSDSIPLHLPKNSSSLESGFQKGTNVPKQTATSSAGKPDSVPPHRPNNSLSSGIGVQKKPRFTPVVATASGHMVVDTEDSHSLWQSKETAKRKAPDMTNPSRNGKFVPVVSAVGRKEDKSGKSFSSITTGSDTLVRRRDQSSDKASASSGKTVSTTGERTPINSDRVRRARGREDKVSSEGNKKKRARLVDLQAMFDSDSEEEEVNRSTKYPRYSNDNSGADEGAFLVEDDEIRRTSAGSNKENSPDRCDVYINGDSDEDDLVVARPTSNPITTGIWKDLNHLSSGNSGSQTTGNRQFGRVTPPLWGKSKSKGKTNNRSNVGQTPPQSSFCEHPWQTAARESDKKASAAVARETGKDGVINLTMEDEAVGSAQQVGPKTVPCPVCHLQIEEKKINTHLDTCLTYNCNALFSP